jgi:LDH2 family malate/lactate/ureidoglycolate dehydrogenase
MLGTNPIAFGAPTDEEFPFLYDAATPITQRGKIEVLARAAKPVPEGWVIDQNNQYVNDPHIALEKISKKEAAFLPLGGIGELLGGHKGYGLGTMVEILSAALQGGSYLYGLTGIGEDSSPVPFRLGHFFMAIDIEHFIPLDQFKAISGNIMRQLRESQKAPGSERIFTAGQKEFEMEKITRARGIPVVPNLQKEILYLQKELNLNQYQFPF